MSLSFSSSISLKKNHLFYHHDNVLAKQYLLNLTTIEALYPGRRCVYKFCTTFFLTM